MMRVVISIIIFCIALTSCASPVNQEQFESNIVHVVLIWLQEPGNVEHTKEIIQATNQLKGITEIQEMHVGNSVPSERKIVDDSFDVGLYMIFKSKEELQRYLIHPKHKRMVQDILRPLADKIVVYDFEDTR